MNVQEIESAIAQLPPIELAELAKWFEEFHAAAWDQQLELDVQSGRLEAVVRAAERDFERGDISPL